MDGRICSPGKCRQKEKFLPDEMEGWGGGRCVFSDDDDDYDLRGSDDGAIATGFRSVTSRATEGEPARCRAVECSSVVM